MNPILFKEAGLESSAIVREEVEKEGEKEEVEEVEDIAVRNCFRRNRPLKVDARVRKAREWAKAIVRLSGTRCL